MHRVIPPVVFAWCPAGLCLFLQVVSRRQSVRLHKRCENKWFFCLINFGLLHSSSLSDRWARSWQWTAKHDVVSVIMMVWTALFKWANWEEKSIWLTTRQRQELGMREKGASPWWDRQRCRGDQSLGSQSLAMGPAEINEVWGLSQAGSPKETMHHSLKVSCSLQTGGRGCGRETEIQEGQQICEQHKSTYKASAAFNASLHLAITALGASPDEKTTQ